MKGGGIMSKHEICTALALCICTALTLYLAWNAFIVYFVAWFISLDWMIKIVLLWIVSIGVVAALLFTE